MTVIGRDRNSMGRRPFTGFRSEIPGLDAHIATDPPLYKIDHVDGDEIVTTFGRIYATSDKFIECFICTRHGAYIVWDDERRQTFEIHAADVVSVERRRARTNRVT